MELTIIHLLLLLSAALDSESNETSVYSKIKNGDQKAFKVFLMPIMPNYSVIYLAVA